ncbi:MAG: undecaprenyl-phosphate glucose phosphotransferase [Gammaproteobacteria bacterium]|nr:undecaprenyl-phosphate glucose phosphotransferase [Gammaproteobacteria bacterium]
MDGIEKLPALNNTAECNFSSFRGILRGHRYDIATLFQVIDAVLTGVVLWVVVWLYGEAMEYRYTATALLSAGLFFVFGQFMDIHPARRGSSIFRVSLQLCMVWMGVLLILMLIGYTTNISEDYPRDIILTWIAAAPVILIIWRGFVYYAMCALRKRGFNICKVAIVGAHDLGAELSRSILDSEWLGLLPVGFYDDRKLAGNRPLATEPIQVIGDLGVLVRHAREGKIDAIYITLPMRAENRIKFLVDQLSDTTVSVHLVPDFFVYNLLNAGLSNIGGFPVVSIHETPFNGIDGWIKRLEDIILAGLMLTVISIPMALIAAGVKLSSPGPVIYKQYRHGLRGNKIGVWKFRTMTVCESEREVKQARRSDARITAFGAFLRRTSLDELPQFINVLQGSMSIVGPRPHAVIHNEEYRKLINGYMLRHKVKPGITGLAQINGWRGETDTLDKMEKRIEHDLAYINNWSFLLDVKIILLTLIRGFSGKNVY